MLLIDIYRYLKRRADKRPVYLKNFVDQSHHHGTRSEEPSVSIIIPTRDKVELLRTCIESILKKTTYKNFEIVVVDNQSTDLRTHQYFEDLVRRGIRIIEYPHRFNYSAICNQAASTSRAEFLCFLNNDTEVLSGGWLSHLVDHAIQETVGQVGLILRYPNGALQHAGIAGGHKGLAGNITHLVNSDGLPVEPTKCHIVSSITFACAIVSRSNWMEIGGLDTRFAVGLNDVEFSQRLARFGLNSVLCTSCELTHHESATRPASLSIKGFFRSAFEVIRFMRQKELSWSSDLFFEPVSAAEQI